MSFRSSGQPEAYIQKTSRSNFSGKKQHHRETYGDEREGFNTKMKPHTRREKYQHWKNQIDFDDEDDYSYNE